MPAHPPRLTELLVTDSLDGARLDKATVELAAGTLSRAKVKRAIEAGEVRVNGRRRPKGALVAKGDRITLEGVAAEADDRALPDPAAPLEVRFESSAVVVVDKPAGQPTAPLRSGEMGTLANALLARYPELAGVGYSPREPGLLHRLDTETSGLVVVARSASAFEHLKGALKDGRITKHYLLVCTSEGLADEGTIAFPIASHPKDQRRVLACVHPRDVMRNAPRPASTAFHVKERGPKWALVEVEVSRALRHQIRAHFAAIEHPLVGDVLYGGPVIEGLGRHALHASRVAYDGDGDAALRFDVKSALPEELAARRLLSAPVSPSRGRNLTPAPAVTAMGWEAQPVRGVRWEAVPLKASRLRSFRRVATTCAIFAGSFAVGRGVAPRKDIVDLAGALSEATAGVVEPRDVRWEPSSGVVSDFVSGRWAIFLASDTKGGPRDVWRARVRLTPEGRPIGVADAHDLTGTPLGDDHALVVDGHRAAFATYAFGQEQSVTVLDLAGEGAQNKTTRSADRAMAWITNAQQTGEGRGVARVDVTLDSPARAVGLALTPDALAVDLADETEARRHRATLDLAKDEIDGEGMHVEQGRHLPKRFVFWAVDTVRAVPWIGPAPIAWLEDKVFALRDDARQLAFKIRGANDADTLARRPSPGRAPRKPPPASLLDASQAGDRRRRAGRRRRSRASGRAPSPGKGSGSRRSSPG